MKNNLLKTLAVIAMVLPMTASAASFRRHHQSPPPPPPPPPITTTVQWGAYAGDTALSQSAFASEVGATPNVVAFFEGWGDNFGEYGSWPKQTLLIFWEPTSSNFNYGQITNGSQDTYIETFAEAARAYGSSVTLVPFDEFNLGDAADCGGAPWGVGCNGNTAAGFIAAWQHIYTIFKEIGATNVRFALDYNNDSEPSNTTSNFASMYPGDAYVDLVGFDAFNFGGETWAQASNAAIATIRSITAKTMWVFSTGSVSGGQVAWIQGLGASQLPFVWFNGGGFQLVSSSIAAFRSII